jgi:hypothetical protein
MLRGASLLPHSTTVPTRVQTQQVSCTRSLRASRRGRTKRAVHERASKPVDCTGPFTLSVGCFLGDSTKQASKQAASKQQASSKQAASKQASKRFLCFCVASRLYERSNPWSGLGCFGRLAHHSWLIHASFKQAHCACADNIHTFTHARTQPMRPASHLRVRISRHPTAQE